MTDFGGGIFLTPDFDLEVDETGDIRTVTGMDELQKDVAFRLASRMDEEIGRHLDTNTTQRYKVIVRDELLSDPRIQEIIDLEITQPADDDTIEIKTKVQTDNSEQELVVNL